MTEELLNDIESRLLAHDSYVEDIDVLLAEVRRLRAALEDITDTPELTSDRAIGIAKRALGEEVAE